MDFKLAAVNLVSPLFCLCECNSGGITKAIDQLYIFNQAQPEEPNLRKLAPLLLLSIIWLTIGWFAKDLLTVQHDTIALSAEQQLVVKAQQLLQKRYLPATALAASAPITEALVDAAIAGMLNWGGDRYADLYGPVASKRYLAGYDDNIGITNLRFDVIDGQKIVNEVPAGSAAAQAGVQVGDILLGTNEAPFMQFTGGYETGILLRGPAGSVYQLTLRRGETTLTLPVKRQQWDYLSHRMIDNKIGYLKTEFFFLEKTESAVEAILREFLQNNIEALIWDLRGSSGGATDSVKTIVSYFREQGALLFTAEFRDGSQLQFKVGEDGLLTRLPMVVLIDYRTFSAGEIAAAAIAPRDQTILMGETTAGKGTIQDTAKLDDSHLLHFTIAKWLTPAGEWLDQIGVRPVIASKDDPATVTDEGLDAARQYLHQQIGD